MPRRSPSAPKPETLWAVYDEDGDYLDCTMTHRVSDSREAAVFELISRGSWGTLYACGYRCLRVPVTPEE